MRHIHGLRAAAATPANVFYTSRNAEVTEGLTSDYETSSAGQTNTWGYNGFNTDAITITTSGISAILNGFTINNRQSGSNPHVGTLYLISGTTTGGTIIAQESFNILLPLSYGQTMIRFSSPPLIAPGTYTCAFGWPSAISFTRTYAFNGNSRRTSSTFGGLTVSYGNVTAFNGTSPLNSSNGTTGTGQGQNVTFEWSL